MAVLRLIAVLLFGLLSIQTQSGDQELDLPAWTSAPDEPNLFLVKTETHSTHLDATNSLLPAVKAGVSKWAQRTFGSDCGEVIEMIPLADFRSLIYENQERVHKSRQDYDAETAKRFEAEYDIVYRGYVRVSIDEAFRSQVQQCHKELRLKNRLCATLLGALFILGLAAILWAYLFANRISRGFYISRLRWIAGAMFVALILICYSTSTLLF